MYCKAYKIVLFACEQKSSTSPSLYDNDTEELDTSEVSRTLVANKQKISDKDLQLREMEQQFDRFDIGKTLVQPIDTKQDENDDKTTPSKMKLHLYKHYRQAGIR